MAELTIYFVGVLLTTFLAKIGALKIFKKDLNWISILVSGILSAAISNLPADVLWGFTTGDINAAISLMVVVSFLLPTSQGGGVDTLEVVLGVEMPRFWMYVFLKTPIGNIVLPAIIVILKAVIGFLP